MTISRRQFVRDLALASAAAIVGPAPDVLAADPPPEVPRIRLSQTGGICFAKLVTEGADWRFLKELKKELKA